MVLKNPDRHHRIRRQILHRNEGLTFILPQRSTKPEIFMSLSHSVLSQSGPPKSVGSGVGGRIPHFNWSIYRGGNFFFFLSLG